MDTQEQSGKRKNIENRFAFRTLLLTVPISERIFFKYKKKDFGNKRNKE